METPVVAPEGQEEQLDSNRTVAFLGPFTSYSHQATKLVFPDEEKWVLQPTGTIKEVFDRVQGTAAAAAAAATTAAAATARYGVVPFENSTHGAVSFTLDCLADRAGEYPDIVVCGEVYLNVHHFLLGRRRRPPSSPSPSPSPSSSSVVNQQQQHHQPPPPPPPPPPPSQQPQPQPPSGPGCPLAPLDHVRRVYSHPQALGQTAAFLARHLPRVETVEVSSTARAAELAAADPTGASAAVAGEAAGARNGLDVLAAHVEDDPRNTTRFFVLRRGRRGDGGEGTMEQEEELLPSSLSLSSSSSEEGEGAAAGGDDADPNGADPYGGARYKTLVSFTVGPAHGRPGALADVLDCFRARRLNLTSIASVPSLAEPFQYLFFVEFEGSRFDDPEGRVRGAFEDLGRVAERWRWLGSWRDRRGRR